MFDVIGYLYSWTCKKKTSKFAVVSKSNKKLSKPKWQ